MLKSMTGYGKAEAVIEGSKYIVEIRSLNGKNADITLKTSLIPREQELEVRQMLTSVLNRGTIDLFITVEKDGAGNASTINKEVLLSYLGQVSEALSGTAWDTTANGEAGATMLSSVLRMPDVLESTRTEMTGSNWDLLFGAIKEAAVHLDEFRTTEGATLKKDILAKVDMIESCIPQVEKFEQERIDTVRNRIGSRLDEIKVQVDQNRLEQEIILYIDKLDINEEKVRLGQHCRYFRETAESDPFPGKKLGFIAQEMGREINTLGSKANHAEIQKIVVLMKAELEKIKEQSMNVL